MVEHGRLARGPALSRRSSLADGAAVIAGATGRRRDRAGLSDRVLLADQPSVAGVCPLRAAARTDARGVTGFDDAVRRATLYLAAGADAIFPEALENAEEFRAFAQAVPAPLLANNTEFGKSPNLDVATFANLGYRMVLFPLTAFRAALKSAHDTLQDIQQLGHQRQRLPQMLTRAELYDLLEYAEYEVRDRKYFG